LAQSLLRAKDPQEVLRLHTEYVRSQMESLAEQARDLATHAAKATKPPGEPEKG
jgi:hypothetical protein